MMADNDNILEPIEGQITLDGGEVKPKQYDISEQLADALNESKERGYEYKSSLTPEQFSAVHNRIGELYKSFQTELDDKMADSWQAFRTLLRTIERTSCTSELMDLATKINRYKPLFNGKSVDDILEDMELSGEAATTATEENRAIIAEAISWLTDLEEAGLTVRQIKDAALFLDANRDLITNGTVQQNVLNARDYLDGKKRRPYRTKSGAAFSVIMPPAPYIITDAEYRHALEIRADESTNHLVIAELEAELKPDGLLYLGDGEATTDQIASMTKANASQVLNNTNLSLIRSVFSVVHYANTQRPTSIYSNGDIVVKLSDFARYHYGNSRIGQKNSMDILKEIMQYDRRILGITRKTGKARYLKVISFQSYDEETDMLSISAPFLNRISLDMIEKRAYRAKDGTIQLSSTGAPKTHPIVSDLAKPKLFSNSPSMCKPAADMVIYCLQTIELAGKDAPIIHVSANTLIAENQYFNLDDKYRLDKPMRDRDRNIILKRVFTCFLKYLNDPEMTYLAEKRPAIIVPLMPATKAEIEAYIPTMKSLAIGQPVYDFENGEAEEQPKKRAKGKGKK